MGNDTRRERADGIPVPEGTMVATIEVDTKLDPVIATAGGKFELELMKPPAGQNMASLVVGDRMSE